MQQEYEIIGFSPSHTFFTETDHFLKPFQIFLFMSSAPWHLSDHRPKLLSFLETPLPYIT